MKSYQTSIKRKYLMRIYLFFALTLVVVFALFSVSIYTQIRTEVLDNEHAHSEKTLTYIQDNIEYMETLLSDMCQSVFYSSRTGTIMYSPIKEAEDDIFNQIQTMRSIGALANTQDYIHSISIYSNADQLYSTYPSLLIEDKILEDILKNRQVVPKLKLISREYSQLYKRHTYNGRILSIIMYDEFDVNNIPNEAVILNINYNWLIASISGFDSDKTDKDNIIIVDENKQIVYMKDQSQEYSNAVIKLLNEDKSLTKVEGVGYTTDEIFDEEHLISYVTLKNSGWTVFQVRSYEEFYTPIKVLETRLMWSILAFAIICILLGFFISNKIYNPVGALIEDIQTNDDYKGSGTEVDEFKFLHNYYDHSKMLIADYEKRRIYDDSIIQSYFREKIMLASSDMSKDEWCESYEKANFKLDLSESIVLCVVQIDNYNTLLNTKGEEGISMIRDLCKNTLNNVLAKKYTVDYIALPEYEDINIVLINIDNNDYKDKLVSDLTRCQTSIKTAMDISFTITISDVFNDPYNINNVFIDTLNKSLYRYSLGQNSIIDNDRIQEQITSVKGHNNILTIEMEKKIQDTIRYGNIDNIRSLLTSVFDDISHQNYEAIQLSCNYIVQIVLNTINKQSGITNTGRKLTIADFTECEVIQEVYTKLCLYIEARFDNTHIETIDKHKALAAEIQLYINKNYMNKMLYTQSIADAFNMSATHIGRIFKKVTHTSITNYINDIRLTKASEQLISTELTIEEIINTNGFDNRSYFYRLFKQKFGTTPKNYRFVSKK